MQFSIIILFFVAFWLIQVWLARKQIQNYQQNLNDIKKKEAGFTGVGIQRAKFNLGAGFILIVTTDVEGNIVDVRQMKGYTVFSRFRQINVLEKSEPQRFFNSLSSNRQKKAFSAALSLINIERQKKNLNLLTIIGGI